MSLDTDLEVSATSGKCTWCVQYQTIFSICLYVYARIVIQNVQKTELEIKFDVSFSVCNVLKHIRRWKTPHNKS